MLVSLRLWLTEWKHLRVVVRGRTPLQLLVDSLNLDLLGLIVFRIRCLVLESRRSCRLYAFLLLEVLGIWRRVNLL